MLLIFGLIGG